MFSVHQGPVFGLETPMTISRLDIWRRKRRKRIRRARDSTFAVGSSWPNTRPRLLINRIVYLGASFVGRAIWRSRLRATTLSYNNAFLLWNRLRWLVSSISTTIQHNCLTCNNASAQNTLSDEYILFWEQGKLHSSYIFYLLMVLC